MRANNSVLWKTFSAFLFFAASLCLCIGILIYLACDRLAVFLVEEQTEPVLHALVGMEKRGRLLKDIYGIELGADVLANEINSEFLVGKQVPEEWRSEENGVFFEDGRFVCIMHDNGIVYALTGSSAAMDNFLARIASMLVIGALATLAALALMALALSGGLARPLIRLASCLESDDPVKSANAKRDGEQTLRALADRGDETGLVARAVISHQQKEREYWQREAAFTADASHELRTPLAVLSGCIEIMLAACQESPLRPHLERMERTTRRMNGTVQALLALARQNPQPRAPLAIAELARDEIAALARDGINVPRISYMTDDTLHVPGNEELARAVIANLARNISSHSLDNMAEMRIDQRGLALYNRVGADASTQGFGLGLSIASRCCRKMGWSLRARKYGSIFAVRIGFGSAPPADNPECGQEALPADGKVLS